MKAVLVIACLLAVGALAQKNEWTSDLGYKINTEVGKTNGWGYVTVNIPASSLSNTSHTWMYVRSAALVANAGTAHVKFWVRRGEKITDFNTPTDAEKAASVKEAAYPNFHVGPFTEAGDYILSFLSVGCSLCKSTTEIQFDFFLQRTDAAPPTKPTSDDPFVPFKIIDNPFTGKYSLPPNKYGAAGYLELESDTDIYIKLEVDSSTRLATSVAFVYQKDEEVFNLNPKSITEDSETLKKFPLESERTGNYMTNPKKLAAGKWYIAPYVTKLTGFSSTSFDFAVGIGHEPSGVGAVVPSLTVLLATVAGLLFYSF